jgi:hypothetical protein
VPHAAQPCSALRCGMMLVHPRRSSVSQVLSAKTHQENGLLVQTGSVRASVSVPHAAQPCSALRCGMMLVHPRRSSVSQVLSAKTHQENGLLVRTGSVRASVSVPHAAQPCSALRCGMMLAASTAFKRFSSSQRENSRRKWFACAETGSVRASVSVPHAAQPCSALRCGMALPHPRRPSVSQVLKAPPQRTCFCLSKRQSECQCAACGATVQRTALWHGAAASTASKRLSSAENSSSKNMFLLVEASERVSVCRMRRNRAAHGVVAWRCRIHGVQASLKC